MKQMFTINYYHYSIANTFNLSIQTRMSYYNSLLVYDSVVVLVDQDGAGNDVRQCLRVHQGIGGCSPRGAGASD